MKLNIKGKLCYNNNGSFFLKLKDCYLNFLLCESNFTVNANVCLRLLVKINENM